MMKKTKKLFGIIAIVAVNGLGMAALSLTGCATKITLQVQRMPNLDTKGIQRIAVMPFRGNYSDAAQYATTVARDTIQNTGQFTMVSDSRINDARRSGEGIENYVDALFVGQITNISENTSSQQGSRTLKDGTKETWVTYTREVSVAFTYHLERARDGSMIGPVMKGGKTSRSVRDNPSDLPPVATMVNSIINAELRYLYRDLAPYTVSVQRVLEKESNKDLKPAMDAALAQVKAGSYVAANKAYLAIWESSKSVAAAVNASILYEAMGETRNAANLMQKVVQETGNPLAGSTLARLNNELGQQSGVEQYATTQTAVESVTNRAVSEAQKVFPSGARLWIQSNTASNQNLVNDVIDNMTAAFIANGVTVIERHRIDMVLAEQNFQLSGNVSDDDFVSIGDLAGANTIVIVGITGSGTGRRLQVRVLDIRTGTVVMQSGTGSEWEL
ncbi:MAG: CsgG/HfaB family protein [Treponema sp.]|jgi:hypothetical protein|nr:CsgG/HfaB family protein [Treponema sp.]